MDCGANKHSFIHGIQVASPCEAPWDKMTGDERVRFCGQCKLNVYNLSEMTTEAAEALIVEKEGKLCVRFYRRTDGTLLTKDCPKGLAAVRMKALRAVASVTGLAAIAVTWFLTHMVPQTATTQPAVKKICGLVEEAQQNVRGHGAAMAGSMLPPVAGKMRMPEQGDMMMPKTDPRELPPPPLPTKELK